MIYWLFLFFILDINGFDVPAIVYVIVIIGHTFAWLIKQGTEGNKR